MKQLFKKIGYTMQALRLLTEPEIAHAVYMKFEKKDQQNNATASASQYATLRKDDLYIHKHYMVQIVQ